jgi:hypothetical protein
LASYTGQDISSGFYFSQKFRVFDSVFIYGNPTKAVENLLNARLNGPTASPATQPQANATAPRRQRQLMPPRSMLVNFMDDHDGRFAVSVRCQEIHESERALEALHSALVCTCYLGWNSVIYYRTSSIHGGNDPMNRETVLKPTTCPRMKTEIAILFSILQIPRSNHSDVIALPRRSRI